MANILDIIIAIILIVGIVRGFMGGIVKQIGAIVGMLAGLLVARLFAAKLVEPFLRSMVDIPQAIYTPLSYLITFILVMWGVQLLALLLQKILETIQLGVVNRLLGAIFAFYKYALVVSVVLNIILVIDTNNQLLSNDIRDDSTLYSMVQPLAPALLSLVEAGVGEEIEYLHKKNSMTVQRTACATCFIYRP